MEDCGRQRWRTLREHGTSNKLSKAHIGSQTLKWQSWGLCASSLGTLSMLWCFFETLNTRSWCNSESSLHLRLLFSYWIALSNLNMRTFIFSYCIFLALFGSNLLEACSFLKWKWKENGYGVRGMWVGEVRRSEGKRYFSWDVLYGRSIYFQ